MITLEEALNTVIQLSPEQQEILIQVIGNRILQTRREEISKDAQEAIKAFHQGQLVPKSAEDVIAQLRTALIENQ